MIAELFPAEERADILNLDLINKAVVSHSSLEMQHLMILWEQYVEPGVKVTCGMCFERILNNFRQIQHQLIKLEHDSKLLDG